MRGKHPQSIFTDQCPAIAAGIRSMLPGTFHGLCSYHIRENASRKMGMELATKVFQNGITEAMYGVFNEDQFQFSWNRMIESTFTCEGTEVHSWLSYIYKFHEQWSSAWVNKNFTCGMRSSQLSESLNSTLRAYLDTKNNLPTFFGEFSRMLENKRYDELQEDFNAFHNRPTVLYRHSLLVEQASKFYTPKIFKNFQNEYANSVDLSSGGNFPPVHGGGMHEITWCRITKPDAKRVDEHVVRFSLDKFTYDCTCLLFDSSGWLCHHILSTMDTISMLGNTAAWSIPTFYMRSRWSVTAKKGAALHGFVVECMEQETEFGRFQRLCGSALPLSTDATITQEITDYVAEQMSRLHVDVRRMTLEHRSKAPLPTQQVPHSKSFLYNHHKVSNL
ncbi:Protein FAR-RED IMPAIRED RESPONSE 1 [Linum perenne]